MDLSDLRIFRTVAEEGGIVRASRTLHRVPSNVTTRIKQLETSLGAQLFFRDKQRIYLSPSGELLLAYATRLLALADEARDAVGSGSPSGTLRLGALESTTASRLSSVFVAFHKQYPEVRIELTTGTNDALVAALLERRIEAAFVAEAPANSELSHLPLFEERLVLITSLAHRSVASVRDVAGDSVIAFPTGCAYRRVVERWFGQDGLASVRVMELSSYHAMVACVAAGAGIAVVPESVLDTVQSAHVARHALPKVLSRRVTPLIWRTEQQGAALVRLRDLAHRLSGRTRRPTT